MSRVRSWIDRHTLRELLVDAGLVGDFKSGRAAQFWAKDTGTRPDLAMPDAVLVATPGIAQAQAQILGQSRLKSSLLGLGAANETLVKESLIN